MTASITLEEKNQFESLKKVLCFSVLGFTSSLVLTVQTALGRLVRLIFFSFHAQIADLLAGDSDDDNDSNDNNDSEDWESVIDGSEPFDADGSECE